MEPVAYNSNQYRAQQHRAQDTAIAAAREEELLSTSESLLIMAALCTLAVSICSVVVL